MANGTGIASLPGIAEYKGYFDLLGSPYGTGAHFGFSPLAVRDLVEDRYGQIKGFLGPTDYASQLKESQDLAKMQLGLALAQRGFAAMGAQPGYGESPMGVLGRTLAAPLAADVSAVAGPLIKQRQAARLAQQQEDRQLKLAAFDQIQKEAESKRNLALKLAESQAKGQTDAARKNQLRRRALTDALAATQSSAEGPGMPYQSNSAFFFRPSLYKTNPDLLPGKNFPFRLVVDPYRRDLDEELPIADQKVLRDRVFATAEFSLGAGGASGDPNVVLPPESQLQRAAAEVLGITHDDFFGEGRRSFAEQQQRQQDAFADRQEVFEIVKNDPSANPVDLYDETSRPRNSKELLFPNSKMKLLTDAFPWLFDIDRQGTLQVAVVLDPDRVDVPFEPATVQNRWDAEYVARRVPFSPGQSELEQQALVNKEAAEFAENARSNSKKVTGKDRLALQDAVQRRLRLRKTLLDYQNAEMGSGGVTGPLEGRWTRFKANWGLSGIFTDDERELKRQLALVTASEFLEKGNSVELGRAFGDSRISNFDVKRYQDLFAILSKGEQLNQAKINKLLDLIDDELTTFMSHGGTVEFSEDVLKEVAEAGVDFSTMTTKDGWHGYGYYGGLNSAGQRVEMLYPLSKQPMPSFDKDQRQDILNTGRLKDSAFDGKYVLPQLNYAHAGDKEPPKFGGWDNYFEKYGKSTGPVAELIDDADFEKALQDKVQLVMKREVLPDHYKGMSREQIARTIRNRMIDAIVSFQDFLEANTIEEKAVTTS
jgi:hypothetical protein